MDYVLDALTTAISLAFLGILGVITGFAIPGLFIVALAPWLDWLAPVPNADPTTTDRTRH
jgi:hypothetical protein